MDKLERLLNLTALLLASRRPLAREEIVERLGPGVYPDDAATARRAFECDKRDMGVPLRVEEVPGSDPPIEGYRIKADEYELRDPGLTADELAALHLAASTVQIEGLPALEGLRHLGGGGRGPARPAGGAGAARPADPTGPRRLPVLTDATASRRVVEMTYHGSTRTVRPYRVDYLRGRWYLTAYDELRDDERGYRVDRIEGPVAVLDRTFEPPVTNVPGVASKPWEHDVDPPVRARLRLDGPLVAWAVQQLGPDHVVEEEPGGSVVVELPVSHRAAFVSFVLSLLEHAEVLSPDDLRQAVVDHLRRIA